MGGWHFGGPVPRWARRLVGTVLLTSGAALMVLNLAGVLASPGNASHTALIAGVAGAGQVPAECDRQGLRDYLAASENGAPFDLEKATRVVHQGTVHSDDRRIGLAENWLQWSLGRWYPPLSHVQNTRRLVSGGLANCSERAQILKSLAENTGHACRFVGLNGHVVLEVQWHGVWRVVDPDYGVVYDADLNELQTSVGLSQVRDKLAEAGYDSATIDRYVDILGSTKDNVVLPVGRPLSPRLFALEAACGWMAWVMPVCSVMLGACALWGPHSPPAVLPSRMSPLRSRCAGGTGHVRWRGAAADDSGSPSHRVG
jgi:hypothetical protein